MVKTLSAESGCIHALACICRTACIYVDLLAKENVRGGQKPLRGTDIASLFEDVMRKDDLDTVSSTSLYREELVSTLVKSCFQLLGIIYSSGIYYSYAVQKQIRENNLKGNASKTDEGLLHGGTALLSGKRKMRGKTRTGGEAQRHRSTGAKNSLKHGVAKRQKRY
ncbi:hypothetical protein POM88_022353 [Heracleum sosnowskyi]|uniref:Uncharacterized protein n=1 Tax=Heracleum sosnowskyi TaxID=360622 RepID=A0AAD8MUS4_9APIA|nr:hypothetical protein POM88_022353 [Heracleum sosnowskyi]